MREDKLKPESPCAEIEENNAARAVGTQGAVKKHHAEVAATYRRFGPMLVKRLQRQMRFRPDEALEIAQEACVRLIECTGPMRSPDGFLWRTARNIAVDRLRHKQVRDAHDRLLMLQVDSIAHAPSPESLWISREDLDICETALQQLPPKCRMAFTLRVFEEMKHKDIADQMGIDTSGVKRYVARAIEFLQSAIDAAKQQKRSDT